MVYDWLEEYLLSLPGTEHDYKVEWGWDRYLIRGKLFAATMAPTQSAGDGRYNGHPMMNLKCDPGRSELLRAEFSAILPGYYCDKKNWICLLLDGDLPEDLIRELCRNAHGLILEKLPKYVQREIEAEKTAG